MSGDLLRELCERGLVHDHTDLEALRGRLAAGPTRLYCGFDPTADSLHVGNLVPLLLLRRFQLGGHQPIALAGGATGMIGDPSGRREERKFLGADELDANVAAIKDQLRSLLDFDQGPFQAMLVDNRDWTEPVGVLDFLRDVGKHLTVNVMLAKESVKARLAGEVGLSFTEFSYMLLQANDFQVLFERHGCELQVGGSDQWGNITAGIDLVRRRNAVSVHGLTVPLVTRADGTKFGKSEGQNVWLSPDRTSPYRFFQHWMGVDDRDVERFLAQLTLLSVEDIAEVVQAHHARPEARGAQRRLARELTELIHGNDAVRAAEAATAVLFDRKLDLAAVGPEAFAVLEDEIPTSRVSSDALVGGDLYELFAGVAALAPSKGDVRKNPQGYYVNNVPVSDKDGVGIGDLLAGRYLVLRKGKANYHLVVADPGS